MTVIGVGCAVMIVIAWVWAIGKMVGEECPLSDDLFPFTRAGRTQFDEITIYNNVGGVRTPIKKIMVPRN